MTANDESGTEPGIIGISRMYRRDLLTTDRCRHGLRRMLLYSTQGFVAYYKRRTDRLGADPAREAIAI